MSQLGHLFRKRQDPYAGADLATAKRLGGAILLLLVLVGLLLTPLTPPTEPLGHAGWAVWGVVIAGFVVCARRVRRHGERVGANGLLLIGYLALLQIALLEWLAGGHQSPYHHLLLPVAIFVATVHPPRRVAPYLTVLWAAAAAPLAYDGWSATEAHDLFAQLLVLSVLAMVAVLMMDNIRAQRIGLRAEGEEARQQARHDAGTGLLNRRALEEALELQMTASRAAGTPVSVIVVDLDDFKAVNDGWGHLAGDECLRSVAEAIQGAVRGPDSCFRWAGDEFAVLLPGAELEDAERVADRMRVAISSSCQRPDGTPVTLCYGAAQLREETRGSDLLDAADRALMSAKAARAGARSRPHTEDAGSERFVR
jgi:diguanylate cyclase (GGDEF)-like protein